MCKVYLTPFTLTWVRSKADCLTSCYSLISGWFSNTVAYGAVYGFTEITDQLETSYALVGTLIAGDTPLQINWHLNNARRGGATLEQARAVRQISIDTANVTGVIWKNQVPEVN